MGTTNATSSYKMYQYEFALPPDLDTLDQVYIDSGGLTYNSQPGGELEDLNVVEFNRYLSVYSDMAGPPVFYNEDGEMHYEGNFPPLDVMVLDYDFLAGEIFEVLFFNPAAITKRLHKGDVVKIIKLWHSKLYKPLVRVEKDNIYYDIYPKYLNIIS